MRTTNITRVWLVLLLVLMMTPMGGSVSELDGTPLHEFTNAQITNFSSVILGTNSEHLIEVTSVIALTNNKVIRIYS